VIEESKTIIDLIDN
jgi:hypothetical protein